MKKVIILDKVGLHARPVALFCQEAKKYESEIVIIKDGEEINGKSPIRIMTAGIEYMDEIIIKATGNDSALAEEALEKLLNDLAD